MTSRYFEALDARAAALRFVLGPRWEFYSGKIGDELVNFEPITVRDPESALYRFRLASQSSLSNGPSYWWSAEMCQVLSSTYRSVPDAPLRVEDVPAPSGFAFYQEPIRLGTSDKFVVATSWIAIAEDGSTTRLEHTPTNPTGYVVIHYSRPPVGYIVPISMSPWSLGDTMAEHFEKAVNISGSKTAKSIQEAVYTSRDMLGLFVAANLILSQRVSESSVQAAPRNVERRLERESPSIEPEVNVVYLRKRKTEEASDGVSRTVDWACQWWVGLSEGGHWRRQPYPSTGEVKRILIPPYIKGPSDKPLKDPKPTVHAVVR